MEKWFDFLMDSLAVGVIAILIGVMIGLALHALGAFQ